MNGRKKLALAALVLALGLTAAAATSTSARADSSPLVFNFYGCTGPAGTPETFSAERVSSSSASLAFHLTDGSGIFVVLHFRDETAGIDTRPTFAPGLNANSVVTCSAIGPLFGHQLTVSGFFAP
jgi:hypothetical protein